MHPIENTRILAPSGSACDNILELIKNISHSIDVASQNLVKEAGLTRPQMTILREIAGAGEVSVGEIAKAINLKQATVTGILERLIRRGFISRRRSEADRRRVLVQITDQGRNILGEAEPLVRQSFAAKFGRLREWEKSMILCSLQRLATIINESDGESGDTSGEKLPDKLPKIQTKKMKDPLIPETEADAPADCPER